MTSNLKFLIAGGAVCLALGGALLALELTKPEENTPREAPETRLQYEKNPEALKSITVSHKNGNYTLIKEGESWVLSGMEDFPLNEKLLGDIAEAASKVSTQKTIEENADLTPYGLSEPALYVKAEFSDSSNTVKEFYLGNSLLDSSLSYFAFKDEATVYAVKASSFSVFYQLPEDLLSLNLFPKIENTIIPQTLILKRSGWENEMTFTGTVTGENGSGYLEWELSSPSDLSINPADYTFNLWGLEADGITALNPNEEDLINAGLDNPLWEASLSGDDKTILLKVSAENGGYCYAMREDVPILYRISAEKLPWYGLTEFDY